LLEQVLAGHPDIAVMEERTCLMDSAAEFFGSDAGLDRLAALRGPQPLASEETPPAALPDPLSRSEREILRLLNRGMTNQEIADQLSITVGTTKWHLNRIFAKLQVRNRTEAISKGRQLKLV